jgi:hypothetical protein
VEPWTGEELRRAAVEALGPHADERAVDVLAHATVTVTYEVARWEGSAGPVQGHRVTMALDATRLGMLRATPAVLDALHAALAASVASRPGEALVDTRLRWSRLAEVTHAAYRDGPPTHGPPTLGEGLVGYLEAAGERELARLIGGAQVEESAGGATLVLSRAERDALRSDTRALAAIDAAVRDLMGPRAKLLGTRASP